MKGSSFGYLLGEGAKNVYVNRLMSFASIGVLVACLLLIGSSLLFSMNVNQVIGFVEDQNEIVAFVDDDFPEEQQEKLDGAVRAVDNLSEVSYISREDALVEQKAMFGEMAVLLEGLEGAENPYPNTYRLRVDNLDLLEQTTAELKAIDGITDVTASTEVAEIITSIKKAVYTGGSAIVIILLMVSLVIIANTIKVTVFNRRKEISIMKCVGATDMFIRLPFIVEGLILGLLSAVIAYGLLWGGYTMLMDQIAVNSSVWIKQLSGSMIDFDVLSMKFLLYFLLGGVGVGTIGSMVFVGKYLKV